MVRNSRGSCPLSQKYETEVLSHTKQPAGVVGVYPIHAIPVEVGEEIRMAYQHRPFSPLDVAEFRAKHGDFQHALEEFINFFEAMLYTRFCSL